MQFSAQRGARAQARRDARPACPSERLQAHMGSRAAPTAQPLFARSGARPLDEGRATTLAGDGERQAGAADAPRTLVHGPIRGLPHGASGSPHMIVAYGPQDSHCSFDFGCRHI